jgi:hypothetical protein
MLINDSTANQNRAKRRAGTNHGRVDHMKRGGIGRSVSELRRLERALLPVRALSCLVKLKAAKPFQAFGKPQISFASRTQVDGVANTLEAARAAGRWQQPQLV